GVEARIRARIDRLDQNLSTDERAAAATAIETEEAARPTRRAVAGYDYTFSVPKSVSSLWAVTDGGTQALIVSAHHAAVADVVALMERDVAATRIGTRGPAGAVAQVEVAGVIATAYDHYDSRSGDPQLHTHVVISNKVQGVHDGKWRTLDGRPMHAAVVALSEHYNAVLADHLTRTLGLGWDRRDRGRNRNPAWEITGVPDQLIETFSSRSRAIEVEKDRLIAAYVTKHGREPSTTTIIKLRAQATLATRPDKTIASLSELTAEWRVRASVVLGTDAPTWATHLLTADERPPVLRADDLPLDMLAEVGRTVVEIVGEKRSTWRRWNLHAEASRQTMGLRFASTADREAVLGLIVDFAEQASLRLTPPELATSPVMFQRKDGTSVFRPKHSTVFSSTELLAAEDRLLDLATATTAPTVRLALVERIARRPDRERRVLADDQIAALTAVALSGRVVDVLVGPAGAGKTTAMNALRRAWESEHGTGSVVGLAPSAAAAQVLADDLGIGTENTAKWLHDHTANGAGFRAGQLVIVDEASLAGTLTLDRITRHAAEVGAKVLLVGDWAQLAAVEAGGAFGMLVRDRDDAPELVDVRRFHHDWERHASLRLRIGDAAVIDTYDAHGRVHDGDTDTMLDAAYRAWLDDLATGRSSTMIAESTETVTALNTRARSDRITAGHVDPAGEVRLHDGTDASPGDLVITRRNDRRLLAGRGWVRNGDRWTVTATHDDGSVTVRRDGHRRGTSVRLPAWYVDEHVELAYAVTAHRAQGSTVETTHTLVRPTMTRETLYVAMTRGRHANTAYVATDQPDAEANHRHPDVDETTGRSVLYGVLQHVGAELSAHQTIEAEHQ
ncbi:MAG: MobF family relaxase, partial [Acidimicrobiia bacterium]